MKMYMIRHGESMANAEHLHAGWSQTPLSPKGEKEARRLAELLKGYTFSRVYSSDLLRARQTQEFSLPDADATVTPLLREISVGDLAGKRADECLQQYGERYLTDKAARDFRFFGGENREMHFARVKEFMDTVALQETGEIVVFCHEGTIRCALEYARDEQARTRPLENCGVFLFEYANSTWTFKGQIGNKEEA